MSTGTASVTDEGHGVAVVALHGLPGTVRDFRWLGAALAGRVRLVRVDLPGFGGTPRGGRTVALRARFVVDVLDALGIERAVLLGHSMGGAVATAVAVDHPERALGLALVASVGFRPHRSLRRLPLGPRPWSRLLRAAGAERLLLPAMRPLMRRLGFGGYADHELVETFHVLARTPIAAHAARLDRVRVPTLLAWSDDDPMVEPAIGCELDRRLPGGPRLRFASGGHPLANTRANELAEALAAWAASLPPVTDARPVSLPRPGEASSRSASGS